MKSTVILAVLSAFLLCSGKVSAQNINDSAVAFGSKISVSTVISALQNNGYQALVAQLPPSPAIVGAVTTGINGVKMLLVLTKCDNSKDDEVCSIVFSVSFNDEKNIINDNTLSSLNQKAVMSRVVLQNRPNGTKGFLIIYNYLCKGFDDMKFLNFVLPSFGADVSRVAVAYNAAANPVPATTAK